MNIIPETTSFSMVASFMDVFGVACHAHYDAACPLARESILMHSPSNGFGQACFQLRKESGPKVFVTAGTLSKQSSFMEKTYDLPGSHILKVFESKIITLIGGRGVEVIFDAHTESSLCMGLRCIAMFGRFIEVERKNDLELRRLVWLLSPKKG